MKKDIIFDMAYYEKRKFIAWRASFIVDALITTFKNRSLVDFGCGVNEFVREFNKI
jgi:hypothetical protein